MNDLFKYSYIDGQWLGAQKGKVFSVHNPANAECIAEVPDMGEAETLLAIDAAARAQSEWAAQSASVRADMLFELYALLLQKSSDFARLITAECGKPIAEAEAEVEYAAAYLRWFAEEARRVYGDIIPSPQSDRELLVIKQAIGVVGIITPWNFPLAMVVRKLAPALAVGCATVVKPSEQTPLSAIKFARLTEQAGLPAGLLNIVTASQGASVGDVLCADQRVAKISFTGSTAVGKLLLRKSAPTVKKLSLELGGNAPFIVFADADLDLAVSGLVSAKFRNAGQTCVCPNRVLVHESLADTFAEKLKEAVGELNVGPGEQPDVQVGPLINQAGMEKVELHVADALSHGARLHCGGKVKDIRGGAFFLPTVLSELPADALLCREETFGPVIGLLRFTTEAEAINLANDSEFGLAAYIYSEDRSQIWRVSKALQVGMVGINESAISTEVAPFGGIKQSGYGREGSRYGLDDYLLIKYLCMGGNHSA